MKLTLVLVGLLGISFALSAVAQRPTPYAGQNARSVSSLADEEVADLLAGKGMGLAKPAELNGYPGPAHVLELADELKLTPNQRAAVQSAFDRMAERAKAAGAAYVAAERDLDEAFRSGTADMPTVEARLARAEKARAEKRMAHISAHLEITPLLTSDQRRRYAELRGYGDDVRPATHQGLHGGSGSGSGTITKHKSN